MTKYPTTDRLYRMEFNASAYGFRIARADNGVVFEEYDLATDEMRRKVAQSPEEMQAIFTQWHAERAGAILKWATEYFGQMRAPEEQAA